MIDLTEIQNVFIAAIRADAGCLAAFDAAKTYSNIPENSDSLGSYARVEISSNAWDTKGDQGEDVRVEVHVFIQETSTLKTLKTARALKTLFNHGVALSIDSGQIVCVEFQTFVQFIESDGKTRHSVSTFRVLASP